MVLDRAGWRPQLFLATLLQNWYFPADKIVRMSTNLFFISSIYCFCTTLGITLILVFRGGRRHLIKIFAGIPLGGAIWGLGTIFFSVTSETDYDRALFWHQIAYIGPILTPAFFTHLVFSLLRIPRKAFLIFIYSLASVFLVANFYDHSRYFLGGLRFTFNQFYWVDWYKHRNLLWLLFYAGFWWLLLGYDYFLLLKEYVISKGNFRNQLKYLILGSAIGWLGGEPQYLPCFGIDVYPISNFLIGSYPIILAYAIFKYRLMDITVAITRTTIFVAVYSLVLGIPFAIALGWEEKLSHLFGNNWWMIPLTTSTVLATAGPFIYLYFQRRAEERLFQEQIRYQTTLRQASLGMGRIKDLKRLVTLIVHIVTRTVRLEHSMIFLNDPEKKQYFLGAMRSRKVRFKPQETIPYNSAIINHLSVYKNPVVYDEIKQRTQDYGDLRLAHLEAEMKKYDAALAVPSFVDENLIAVIMLGKKLSGQMYTNDDLAVFSILANQAALAIENAEFYDDMRQTHQQLFKAEKMATIGIMADGLSHQINNRLHALGFIAGDVLDTIKLKKDVPMSDELKEMLVDIEHALARIQDNVAQGGEIVQGLLKYSRKGEEGFTEVELDHLIDASIEMTRFKIKAKELRILREYDRTLPKIKGNFTQLQEVFFNLIDNAYDAMMQRKEELKEEGYIPTIKIQAANHKLDFLDIVFQDNGIGIKDDDRNKLFTPFFTTKLSSRKGTGLGLYVIRKLIEENHGGTVRYDSKYKVGTQVLVRLPTA